MKWKNANIDNVYEDLQEEQRFYTQPWFSILMFIIFAPLD
ncbi:hypothetical protein SAMN04488134_10347 [Amphibacillus marinus]|uniref:Uncharacterized protein n=1 Tax=Amphibacillus marinus TaxID=872970 RepID=A0A1H8L1L8_9BACI|nr:hypothetical protein SAMN04488134_10347 [Amphibacillus marinus]